MTRVETSARSLVATVVILLTLLGAGGLMGWMDWFWFPGRLAPGKAVHLTQEPMEAWREGH